MGIYFQSRKAFEKLVEECTPKNIGEDHPQFLDRLAKKMCGLTVAELQARFPNEDRGLFAKKPNLNRVAIAAAAVRFDLSYNTVRASLAGSMPVREDKHPRFARDMQRLDPRGWKNRPPARQYASSK